MDGTLPSSLLRAVAIIPLRPIIFLMDLLWRNTPMQEMDIKTRCLSDSSTSHQRHLCCSFERLWSFCRHEVQERFYPKDAYLKGDEDGGSMGIM